MESRDLTRVFEAMQRRSINRRQLGKSAAAASAAALAARAGGYSARARQDVSGELVFRTWGGAMTEALQSAWVDPFQEAFDVSVIMDTGELPEVQLQQQKGNPQFDVVALNRIQVHQLRDADVLQSVDPTVIPNLEFVYPELASVYGLSTPAYFGEMGLVYNTDQVTTNPTSWEEMWNPDFAGHVVTPTGVDGADLFIPPLANMLGTSWDGDLTAVWEKLSELAPSVLTQYTSAGQMVNLLETEEAWIGPWYNGRAWNAIGSGLPLAYVTPDEGATIVLIDMVIPQGAPNIDAAYAFINFALEPEQQAAFAAAFSYAPSRMDVELPEEVAQRMPYGQEGIDKLIIPDWDEFDSLRPEWSEQWNTIFGLPAE